MYVCTSQVDSACAEPERALRPVVTLIISGWVVKSESSKMRASTTDTKCRGREHKIGAKRFCCQPERFPARIAAATRVKHDLWAGVMPRAASVELVGGDARRGLEAADFVDADALVADAGGDAFEDVAREVFG